MGSSTLCSPHYFMIVFSLLLMVVSTNYPSLLLMVVSTNYPSLPLMVVSTNRMYNQIKHSKQYSFLDYYCTINNQICQVFLYTNFCFPVVICFTLMSLFLAGINGFLCPILSFFKIIFRCTFIFIRSKQSIDLIQPFFFLR